MRPLGGLLCDTDPNLWKINVVSTQSSSQLEDLETKTKTKNSIVVHGAQVEPKKYVNNDLTVASVKPTPPFQK